METTPWLLHYRFTPTYISTPFNTNTTPTFEQTLEHYPDPQHYLGNSTCNIWWQGNGTLTNLTVSLIWATLFLPFLASLYIHFAACLYFW